MNIIVSHASEMSAELLKAVYVFRAKVFHHILKWSVPLVNGQEIDRFDSLNPVWVVAEQDGVVQGCLRILPTTGDYLMQEPAFSGLSDAPLPAADNTVEISRFAVDLDITDKRYAAMLTNEILRGMLDYLMLNNLHQGVCVTSVSVERLLRSLDVRMERLGRARKIENCLVVAAKIDFTIGFSHIRRLQKAA
jgi:N-acyl-L-homoserine lactone synthetase